jgi:hypothetical protein
VVINKARESIINFMQNMERAGVHCFNCQHCQCCTYTSNSMMITPVESLEITLYLIAQNRWNQELFSKLEQNIEQFQLKNFIVPGSQKLLRKYYTCPFLIDGPKGCSLSRKIKPYGCLAFNASNEKSYELLDCQSSLTELNQLEDNFKTILKRQNDFLEDKFKWYCPKMPIPNALLSLTSFSEQLLIDWGNQLLADS